MNNIQQTRKKIPAKIESEVLFLNRHKCCICREPDKDVQLHHIDGNNSNNSINNLAVVCLNCHSKVTGTRGLGKGFSPLEVTKYKKEWELKAKRDFGLPYKKPNPKKNKLRIELFEFEIQKIIIESLSRNDSDINEIEQDFEKLRNIAILEGFLEQIIKELNHIFSLSSIYETNKPIILSKYLCDIFAYLADPEEIKMTKKDEQLILSAIEIIEFSHNLSVESNKKYQILKAFIDCLNSLIEIAINYKNEIVFTNAIKIIDEINESCNTRYYPSDRRLPKLISEIKEFKTYYIKELKKENINWKI